jgi:hypothetical protein
MVGPIDLEPFVSLPRRSAECRFRAADYNPLEDSVEIVLEDDRGLLRVIIEAPLAIWVEHEGTSNEKVVFETASGSITLQRLLRNSLVS